MHTNLHGHRHTCTHTQTSQTNALAKNTRASYGQDQNQIFTYSTFIPSDKRLFHSFVKHEAVFWFLICFQTCGSIDQTVCVWGCVCTSLSAAHHWTEVRPLVSGICPTSATWCHRTDPTPCHEVTWDTKHRGTHVCVCVSMRVSYLSFTALAQFSSERQQNSSRDLQKVNNGNSIF